MNIKNPKMLFTIMGGIVVLLLLILVVIIFTRSDDSSPGSPNAPRRSSDQIELAYWGLWEEESVMEPIIREYESNNPNVKIKYSQQSFFDYEATLYTRLQQGKAGEAPAPDIVKINNSWLPKFESLLAPIPQSTMSQAEYSETFFPTCTDDFTGSNGEIYAIPLGIDGLALFYNKVLLSQEGRSEPPRDWDGIIELAKQLTKRDSAGRITQAGLAMGTVNNVYHAADIFSFLLLQNNIDIVQVNNGIVQVDLSSNKAKSALQFYKSFETDHKVWSPDLPLDLEMFFRGELAMFFAPSWRVFDIIVAAPAIEFDIVPAPQLEANDPVYYAMYWGESVSISSKNQAEAWNFIKFLSEKENIQQFHAGGAMTRAFGQPYPRVDLSQELANSRYVGPIMEMAPTMRAWKMSQNPEVEKYIKQGIADNDLNSAQTNINNFLSGL